MARSTGGGSRGGGSHGAGHADLALTAHFGAADAGVGLDDVAEEAGGGEGTEDARLAEAVNVAQLADDSFDVLPFVAFLWGHIPHPLGYLVLQVPSPRT